MEALNKKILTAQEFLEDITILQLSFTVLAFVIINLNSGFTPIINFGVAAVSTFTVLFISKTDIRIATIALLLLGLFYLNTIVLIMLSILTLFLISIEYIIGERKEALALLFLSNIVHLGDAITTFIGMNLGREETNILLEPLMSRYGYEIIFPIKALVIPLTIYPYLKFNEEKKIIYLKAVFIIGLYLIINNLLVIFR